MTPSPSSTIPAYLRRIGRGAAGARPLTLDEADDLMTRMLDGRAEPMQLGAIALAMRMKGETADELIGFGRAAARLGTALPASRPTVVIASPNGARRLPNLVPLLASALARAGRAVLVHGPRLDPGRVTTAQIFEALGWPTEHGELPAADVAAAWARGEPAFVATVALHPPLGRLLATRAVIGLRSSAHTLVKLLEPVVGAPTLRLAAHTHPEFGRLLRDVVERTGASAMLLRGTEGEPVADPRRRPAIDTYLRGRRRAALSCDAQEGSLVPSSPDDGWPAEIDAASTARYVREVVDGRRPMPAPIAAQAALIGAALDALAAAPGDADETSDDAPAALPAAAPVVPGDAPAPG